MPVADICEMNSLNRRSITPEPTLPRLAIAWEMSLISSSSISEKMPDACSSLSDIIRIAALWDPLFVAAEMSSTRLIV